MYKLTFLACLPFQDPSDSDTFIAFMSFMIFKQLLTQQNVLECLIIVNFSSQQQEIFFFRKKYHKWYNMDYFLNGIGLLHKNYSSHKHTDGRTPITLLKLDQLFQEGLSAKAMTGQFCLMTQVPEHFL